MVTKPRKVGGRPRLIEQHWDAVIASWFYDEGASAKEIQKRLLAATGLEIHVQSIRNAAYRGWKAQSSAAQPAPEPATVSPESLDQGGQAAEAKHGAKSTEESAA